MSKQTKEIVGYLVFSRVKIQDANAISSPITYGFPAVSGFLGAFHAMSRQLQQHKTLGHLSLDGVLIACHRCEVKAYRQSAYGDYTFNQTRNPIKKDGSTASIIEEGKCGLTVTLAVEVKADDIWDVEEQHTSDLAEFSKIRLQQQRLAGGSVMGVAAVHYLKAEDIGDIKRYLLPASVLMNAQQELKSITRTLQQKNETATALDALIEAVMLHHIPQQNKQGGTDWYAQSEKHGRGWLVPMPIGYQGISACFDPGVMRHSRNPEYVGRYVEAIYSLGKWVFPYRIDDLQHAFWHYRYDAAKSLYLTVQPNQSITGEDDE
ncbi:CRISPR-associated protein Csy2 [Chelonobacter oris]|uniref:CRISPR-associated protein Csy2 n=1 Tax=Chelonobacter oris TaxID=505317 RepID=A0A0A3AJ40_9PAST|nr:type I-F CRISPR-associated protein Csy2 [Chelonobacter oris]KGQ69418.1 CRISPR-associated protein Csy2 [Chelonobacter oris]